VVPPKNAPCQNKELRAFIDLKAAPSNPVRTNTAFSALMYSSNVESKNEHSEKYALSAWMDFLNLNLFHLASTKRASDKSKEDNTVFYLAKYQNQLLRL
jgi:hypothetical protein